MRKLTIFLIVIFSLALFTLLTLHILWRAQKSKMLNIYLLDKTVNHPDRPEHKSLVWVLNHNKIVGPDGQPYNYKTDYWGIFPIDVEQQMFDIKSLRLNEIDAYAAVYDAAYYADCFGVYAFNWYKENSKKFGSSKIYGGLNQNDYLLLKRMKDLGKLIIGEYNMLSSPTNALIRSKTEDLFNLEWSGWSAKYINDLSQVNKKESSNWMIKLYEQQHLKPWPKKGSGIILLSNDGIIDVLVEDIDLKSSKVRIIVNPPLSSITNAPVNVYFNGWFDIVYPKKESNILASFNIDANAKGMKKLKELGLPAEFPAIVQARTNEFIYYFCGDFAENRVNMFCSKLKGGKNLNRLLGNDSNGKEFFNNFYEPLISHLLKSYLENLSKNKH